MTRSAIDALHERREAEKQQTLFYRALAAEAEERGDAALSERLQQLHADEQHHLSRLTARLLELGEPTPDLAHVRPSVPPLDAWEAEARRREEREVDGYEALLAHGGLDEDSAALVREILDVERNHARELGGKWTMA